MSKIAGALNIAYLHEVVGALQQILKAFLVSNIGEYHHHYSSVL
jgi:hypothetical protein